MARKVSKWEHAFRAGRGEPVELVPHPEYPGESMEPWQPIQSDTVQVAEVEQPSTVDDVALTTTVNSVPDEPAVDARAVPAAGLAGTRIDFQSSNIRAAELAVDGTLTVEFTSGKQYRFASFSAELLTEWQAAKSAGSWFDANIKKRPDRHPPIGK